MICHPEQREGSFSTCVFYVASAPSLTDDLLRSA